MASGPKEKLETDPTSTSTQAVLIPTEEEEACSTTQELGRSVTATRTRSRRSTRPVRPALRTNRTYYSAQSFDDYAWHRGDSDDSDEERRRAQRRLRRQRTANTIKSNLSAGIPETVEPKPGPETDIEKGKESPSNESQEKQQQKDHHLDDDDDGHSDDDEHLVTWDGPDDPQNPKNWPLKRKWAAVFVVSSFTFISPVSSAILAPALTEISKDLHLEGEIMPALVMSIFVLAYAIGPLLFGPLSEVYGRVRVLQLSNLFFLVWNLACAWAKNTPQMLVFRFLSGIGGSAPLAIGGAVLGDCFISDERGKAISLYSLAPLLGPAVGPVAGGFIASGTTWRWIFWATSIADVLVQISGYFFLQGLLYCLCITRSMELTSAVETYTPILLKRKAAQLKQKNNDEAYYTKYDDEGQSLAHILRHAMVRPFIMLGTQPIIQAIASMFSSFSSSPFIVFV
jgi:multidrug resistance protein